MSIYRGRNKNEIYLASLLYDAIEDLDTRSVKILLSDKGADPNLVLPKKKIAPFHLVIGNDVERFALEVTSLILQHGGDPNVQSDDGLTPVHIAAAWGRYELLKLLLDCGGSPEVRDINRKTPMHYALEENYPECYDLLKLYVTDKAGVLFKENEDCVNYDFILDKILVNNGTTVGEYEVVNEYKTDSIYGKDLERFQNLEKWQDLEKIQDVEKFQDLEKLHELEKLHHLPKSDTKEYVMNWFNNHLRNEPNYANKIPNGSTTCPSEDSEDSLKESDEERHSHLDPKNICFRKVYRKKIKTPRSSPIKTNKAANVSEWSECKNFSKESGINTLLSTSSPKKLHLAVKEASSDYLTCASDITPDLLERNIFEFDIANDETKSLVSATTKSEGIGSSDLSFVSVSEVYKYVDQEKGIVLYERRFLKTPLSDNNGSVKSFDKHSLPETIDYDDCDSETIRKELTLLGYNPGPITVTTKRVYLKKLKQLKKLPAPAKPSDDYNTVKAFSPELEKTLKNGDWLKHVSGYKSLDAALVKQFASPDPARKWREGVNKSCFTYLLLDPRMTNNLPARAESLKPSEVWSNFLSAVFYVGKGKRARPYDHLYEAVDLWNNGERRSESGKLNRILDIWSEGCGVVCLHLFQNTIPVEAYTREAAIIEALRVENLCNEKGGNFYGVAATWTQKEKAMLGVFLLYKAMMIFLNEGERQLCPADID